jgi:hypothetical protein
MIITFSAGLFAGAIMGVVIMCFCFAAKESENNNRFSSLEPDGPKG